MPICARIVTTWIIQEFHCQIILHFCFTRVWFIRFWNFQIWRSGQSDVNRLRPYMTSLKQDSCMTIHEMNNLIYSCHPSWNTEVNCSLSLFVFFQADDYKVWLRLSPIPIESRSIMNRKSSPSRKAWYSLNPQSPVPRLLEVGANGIEPESPKAWLPIHGPQSRTDVT